MAERGGRDTTRARSEESPELKIEIIVFSVTHTEKINHAS
jgi:hypothetical protein